MPNSVASQTLFLYSTTVSDVGTVRSNNQDSAFAGEHLIAICDGMGGRLDHRHPFTRPHRAR